jgi:hypothetical protein
MPTFPLHPLFQNKETRRQQPRRRRFSPAHPTDETGPDPTVARALFERARQLVDGVSFGAVDEAMVVFTADSVRRALDWMEKRNRKPGSARKDWGYVLGMLRNRARTGWPEEPPPRPQEPPKPAGPTAEELAEQAREKRVRGLWEALSEEQRQAIRGEVRKANPGLGHLAGIIEALSLAELERRCPADAPAAEEPRAP